MKKLIFPVFILFLLVSCKKNTAPPPANNSIVGKWKLTESYIDPGDGSGTWRQADPSTPGYLSFHTDGSMTITPYNVYDADHYKIISDSTMIFYRGSDSFNIRYTLTEFLLSVYPPCVEGCGERYVPSP
ncbi:MAG TPA: hypothetical protein VII28_13700 [Puia sp.]